MNLEWLEVVALLTALVEAIAACIWLSAGIAENRAATATAKLAAARLDAASKRVAPGDRDDARDALVPGGVPRGLDT